MATKGEKNMSGTTEVVTIDVKEIVVDHAFNARKTAEPRAGLQHTSPDDTARELAKSIKKDGQLTPVMVEKLAKPTKDGKKYYLIFGFQRMRAISGPKEEGFLGLDKIRATVTEPMSETDRMYLNMVENVARADLSAYDLALRCFELHTKHNEKGTTIAARLGKGVGYVNNLIRIRKQCIKPVLDRWTKEMSPGYSAGRVCTVDQLAKWASLSEEDQRTHLAIALGEKPTDAKAEGDGEGSGTGNGTSNGSSVKRATMKELKKAKEACITKIADAKERKAQSAQARYEGVLEALLFAMGEKESIRGVYINEDDAKATADAETVADQN